MSREERIKKLEKKLREKSGLSTVKRSIIPTKSSKRFDEKSFLKLAQEVKQFASLNEQHPNS